VLAEFSSVVDAVQCAVAVQNEIQTRNAELPDVSGRVKMSQNWRFKNAVYDEGGAGCRNRFF
jgi:class 3 adenylate cyclase